MQNEMKSISVMKLLLQLHQFVDPHFRQSWLEPVIEHLLVTRGGR